MVDGSFLNVDGPGTWTMWSNNIFVVTQRGLITRDIRTFRAVWRITCDRLTLVRTTETITWTGVNRLDTG